MLNRRLFLGHAGLWVMGGGLLPPAARAAGGAALEAPAELPAGAQEAASLEPLPGKLPLLKRTFRPPNYETPLRYLDQDFTPNDAFFVRYHLSIIPPVDAASWQLTVGGDAAGKQVRFTLAELRSGFEQVEIAAVCQCAGNRRGLFDPHVPGVQWGYGAMGHARWQGVRLRDLLRRAEVGDRAVEVAFEGADSAPAAQTPDFVKSLPLAKALDDNTLVALSMNGAPLPAWNGFPARLVVPGWAAAYWMKHLTAIRAVAQPVQSFWMKTAYRIPAGLFPVPDQFPSQAGPGTTPIAEMLVNSLITNLADGQRVPAGRPVEVRGVAWDGGSGIRQVAVSSDGGRSWQRALLGADLGRFAWRRWSHRFTPLRAGPLAVLARATSRSGAAQGFGLIRNPAGYHHNLVQRVRLAVE